MGSLVVALPQQMGEGLMDEILGRRAIADDRQHEAAQATLLGPVEIGDVEQTGSTMPASVQKTATGLSEGRDIKGFFL